MPSRQDSGFHPLPPIRTSTGGSNRSQFSGTMSPGSETALSPTTGYARDRGTKSPVEASFFEAISRKVQNARSRSRSRGKARERSRSPMVLPPDHIPPTSSTAAPMSPTGNRSRPQKPRHAVSASQGSIQATSARPDARPVQSTRRTSTDMWRGRQTNSWLFNDFSFTEATKDIIHRGRKS